MAFVSVVGNIRNQKDQQNEQFTQGLEKLALAMQGRQYIVLIVAENQPPQAVQIMRKEYQDLYTKLSPLQKVQTSDSSSNSTSRSKSFAEMDGKQKAADNTIRLIKENAPDKVDAALQAVNDYASKFKLPFRVELPA